MHKHTMLLPLEFLLWRSEPASRRILHHNKQTGWLGEA